MLTIVNSEVEKYLESLLPERDQLFIELEKRAEDEGFPAINPQVGMLLELLARSIGAKRIMELGSGFGYSGLWLVRALPNDGRLILTDGNEPFKQEAEEYFSRIGKKDLLDFRVGDSVEILRNETMKLDLIFNDVDKEAYPEVVDIAYEKLRTGGLLITDNTIWYGHVVGEDPDDTTRKIMEHNEKLSRHSGFLTVQVPLRDGLSVSYKL